MHKSVHCASDLRLVLDSRHLSWCLQEEASHNIALVLARRYQVARLAGVPGAGDAVMPHATPLLSAQERWGMHNRVLLCGCLALLMWLTQSAAWWSRARWAQRCTRSTGCCVYTLNPASGCAQALDGGYLALLVVEAARGRKLPKALEQTIMASGLLLLSGLGFFLILRDVGNLTGLTRGGLM